MVYEKYDKFYFGKDFFRLSQEQQLSLGVIGLLEKYSSMLAFNGLKHPWITLEDVSSWCKDDLYEVEHYIEEGIKTGCLIRLNEEQAIRLLKNPLENGWLFE